MTTTVFMVETPLPMSPKEIGDILQAVPRGKAYASHAAYPGWSAEDLVVAGRKTVRRNEAVVEAIHAALADTFQ
jgi:hypothetical protein